MFWDINGVNFEKVQACYFFSLYTEALVILLIAVLSVQKTSSYTFDTYQHQMVGK